MTAVVGASQSEPPNFDARRRCRWEIEEVLYEHRAMRQAL
jgi:hypothetical protein